ncbi:membrane-targeted effector domain-containing toxin [Pseudomonas sp. Irchel s3b2]|uniref:membrane-targeted effector domain-containing toxin n=1 Tax=Pseudomonas sp. Irchel s3b2 TaxID=2009073 RepID=UPI000BA4A805|nr:membrane-targeted effector domain-containing toxin [Pseudomonas sp. Irchel s3b2]
MNSTETRPLPNAADKAVLKAIATTVIQTCPGLKDTAHEVAGDLLKKYGITGLDPDHVYFHRFQAAQSSSKTFTGWEHVDDKPTSSLTLTQLVIQRFRATDQDNTDLLDLYAGFYSVGPDAGTFDETNEVRLHGNEVLKDFWSIDFSSLYTDRLTAFWNNSGTDFRTLAKCDFLNKAVQARDKHQLSDDDFNLVVDAVMGPMTWPISLQQLQSEHPDTQMRVRTLDVDGYVATNILRIVAPKGRQIVYLPGETDAFQVLETATDMHWWMLQRMNAEAARQAFMTHFSLTDRQSVAENITDIMNRLVSTWGKYDHHLINQKNQVIHGDAFSWMRDSSKDAMFDEAKLSLTSNGDLRKKLWIGYLSAGVKVFGPMAVVGWPVALPVVGASIANMGLNIDQAVNAKTAEERKAGILGAVLSSIDLLFNLLVLKGPGSLTEIGPEVDAAEAAEMADLIESTQSAEGTSPVTELEIAKPATNPPNEQVPDAYKLNEPLNEDRLEREPGQFQGTYRLDSNPLRAIKLNDSAYYVRYVNDPNGRSYWAIIDPANPHAFTGPIPVRLSEGQWEIVPRLGLKGGMDVPPASAGAASEPTVAAWARVPGVHVAGLEAPDMRELALGGADLHGAPGSDTVREFEWAHQEPRRILVRDARTWYEVNPPVPRIPVSTAQPIETPGELLEMAFANKPGLIVGERYGSIGSKQFLIENMPALAQRGVRTLYLQELLANLNQLDLDTFARTGEMPEELENYLKKLDIKAGNDPDGRFNLQALVKAANDQRIRVQAIDMSITYNIGDTPLTRHPDDQMARSFFASEVIHANQYFKGTAKWVALVNQENMTTFRGYRGISEQTDALSLRIDDVPPGHVQPISVDPGLAVEYADYPGSPVDEAVPGQTDPDGIQALIKGDWRVQMQTPWAYRSLQALKSLLSEPGMFTFQRYRSSILVVYRDADYRMADSVLRSTPGGRLNLDTPLAPAFESMTVDNLDELKRALIARGMRPMGWSELSDTEALAAALGDELTPTLAQLPQGPRVPENWQANELLEGTTPVSEPGKYQGIYRLDSDPSTAIMLNDTAYYVRFQEDANDVGHWAIVDPQRPSSFAGSIPVRLNAEGEWETMPRYGLKGGGKPSAPAGSSTAVVPLPASEYDVPPRLRPHLEEGASGLAGYSMRDAYDGVKAFDPYRDFKAIRKRLYHDATEFFKNPALPPKPPTPAFEPSASSAQVIKKIFENARGLVIGESHGDIGSKEFLIENMSVLAEHNVKTLYMEHLLTDFHQAALDSFTQTGAMPKELETYLKALDAGHMTDPLERYTFLELVKAAKKQRIHVQAIDSMASYRVNGMEITSGQTYISDATARQKMMNYFARTIIRTDQAVRGAHKWVALMGNSHSNTFQGVAGVSELEEGIGIRVEDVMEGQSKGIAVDPGKTLPTGEGNETAWVKGDLRLQMESPWVAKTTPEIETLLTRPGMYTLKQEPTGTYLMHRGRDNAVVRTLIETDDSLYFIERPRWPSVNGKRFANLKLLLKALDDMNMTLAGWSKPL